MHPETGTIQVIDRLQAPADSSNQTIEFAVSSRLQPMELEGMDCARPTPIETPANAQRHYVVPAGDDRAVTLCFRGTIHQDAHLEGDALRAGLGGGDAQLDMSGAYLGPGAGWYPRVIDNDFEVFALDIALPPAWHAVSQGAGHSRDEQGHARWQEDHPQRGIHLVAGPWHVWRDGRAEVYLRDAEPDTAQRYLTATHDYLRLYEGLIGPYPYAKFALVENTFQSGWGMPSFTLLGGRVLRLPFILHTSYPHEILHNWWGNGVYVDYAQGNWSEGLTTYLADHALAERNGDGQRKRRDALTAYARYDGEGLALSEFVGRHDRGSQAVGYGKAFMFFHMLRRRLGDQTFVAGLRRFYADNRFRTAGYRELRAAFEAESGERLGRFFQSWVVRPDAPALAIDAIDIRTEGDAFVIRGTLRQTQAGEPFPLRVPIAVMTDAGTHEFSVDSVDRETAIELRVDATPNLLAVDPRNDLFRLLDAGEIPPALGDAMHADRIALVLPREAEPAVRAAWLRFAKTWAQSSTGVRIVWDNDFIQPEAGEAAWYLGRDNRHRCELENLLEADGLQLPDQQRGDSIAVAVPPAADDPVSASPRAWLFTDNPQALPGLARKLPHYGRYGWLRFAGDEPTNVDKGDWPVTHSPLRHVFRAGAGLPITPLPPLLPTGP